MFQQRTKPPSVMGFNPFEYGLQQIPLNTPFFKHFFKQTPPFPFQSNTPQKGQPFQMDNPFSSSFMNPNAGQMNNPFSSAFFQMNQNQPTQGTPNQSNSYNVNPNGSEPQSEPQPLSNFDFNKMNSGVEKAMGLYNQVKPM